MFIIVMFSEMFKILGVYKFEIAACKEINQSHFFLQEKWGPYLSFVIYFPRITFLMQAHTHRLANKYIHIDVMAIFGSKRLHCTSLFFLFSFCWFMMHIRKDVIPIVTKAS